MFERFTDAARQSVFLAQEEARRMHHGRIGTEHLLLGLLGIPDGIATRALATFHLDLQAARANVVRVIGVGGPELGEEDAEALRTLGIDLDEVRRTVEEQFGPGALDRARTPCRQGGSAFSSAHIPFAPRAKKALELALREATRMHDGFIGTEHVLLGVAREGEGVGVRILAAHGASADAVRSAVEAELRNARPDAS